MEVYLMPNTSGSKPTNVEIVKISKEILTHKKDLNLYEIYLKLIEGYTILPSIFNKVRRKENFIKTKLIFLDFDNEEESSYISFDDICLNPYVRENAVFGYETFSSTLNKNKFRICFVFNQYIYSETHFKEIINQLLQIFPTADIKCKDVTRLFFGGTGGKIFNLNNRLDLRQFQYNSRLLEDTQKNKEQSNLVKHFINHDRRKIKYAYTLLKINLPKKFRNYEEAESYIKTLNMYQMLGIREDLKSFKCLFNADNNPSASIYTKKEGNQEIYLYNNFAYANYKNQNIIMLLKKCMKISKHDVILFLCDVLKIQIEYREETKIKSKQIDNLIMLIESENMLKNQPNLNKVIKSRKTVIIDILKILQTSLHTIKGEERFIIYESLGSIADKVYGKFTNRETSRKKVEKVMNVLTYLKILKKHNLDVLEKNMKENILKYQKSKEHEKHINIYELNMESTNISLVEKQAEKLISNAFSYGRFTNEYLTYISREEHDNVFIQDKQEDKKTLEFKSYLTEMLTLKMDKKNKPFIYEQDIKNDLKLKYSKKSIEKYYKVVIQDVLEYLSLTRNKITNQNIQDFGIDNPKSRPNIIYFI